MFDNSNRQVCQVKGSTTNTPLHALTTLNDPTFVEAARVFAGRILKEGGKSDSERLSYAYSIALGRTPVAEELDALQAALIRSRKHYASSPEDAKSLASVGQYSVNPELELQEYAAYTNVAQVIFNTDEFLTRE